jgi:hypothetical protein
MGHLAYVITHPILDLAVFGSSGDALLLHSDAWDASTQHSIPSLVGVIISPLSFVANRYLPFFFTASACFVLGLAQNLAHWCTAQDISGLVDFSKYSSLPMTCL